MPPVSVDPMRFEDLDEVLAIERLSFQSPWSRHAFVYELRQNRVAHLWVARRGGEPGAGREADAAGEARTARAAGGAPDTGPGPVAGYACLWFIADEVHVTNLAVHPARRGQGVGRVLLGTLLEHYRRLGARRVALEVRPSNAEALHLYASFGFRQVGFRRGYYFDTGEDALLLEARLDAPGEPAPAGSLGASGAAGSGGPTGSTAARNPRAR